MAGAVTAWIAELCDRHSLSVSDRHSPSVGDRLSPPSWDRRSLDRWLACLSPLTVTCAVLAVSPDFDNFFHTHRTYSHSLGAVAIVWALAALIGWRLRVPVVKVATVCAAAYGSHLLLDWLGRDDSAAGGIMALWPITTHGYRSGLNLFLELRPHARFPVPALLLANARAIARELSILALPFACVLKLRLDRCRRAETEVPVRAVNTRKSPGRSSARVVPRPRDAAAVGTAGTSDRRARRATPRGSPNTRRGR
jgi:hypothetical protein